MSRYNMPSNPEKGVLPCLYMLFVSANITSLFLTNNGSKSGM